MEPYSLNCRPRAKSQKRQPPEPRRVGMSHQPLVGNSHSPLEKKSHSPLVGNTIRPWWEIKEPTGHSCEIPLTTRGKTAEPFAGKTGKAHWPFVTNPSDLSWESQLVLRGKPFSESHYGHSEKAPFVGVH